MATGSTRIVVPPAPIHYDFFSVDLTPLQSYGFDSACMLAMRQIEKGHAPHGIAEVNNLDFPISVWESAVQRIFILAHQISRFRL